VRLGGVDVSSVVIATDGSRADVLVSLPPGQERGGWRWRG